MGPKINARQQRHVGALRNTLGETTGKGITPGSPRLTSAAPDGGERRRPMLTRQNRKGNIEPSSPKFCPSQGAQTFVGSAYSFGEGRKFMSRE